MSRGRARNAASAHLRLLPPLLLLFFVVAAAAAARPPAKTSVGRVSSVVEKKNRRASTESVVCKEEGRDPSAQYPLRPFVNGKRTREREREIDDFAFET